MKKKVKTVCQIIRFRGKIEAFLVSIEEFSSFRSNPMSYVLLSPNVDHNFDSSQ